MKKILGVAAFGLIIALIISFHLYSQTGRPSKAVYQLEIKNGVKFFNEGRLEYRFGIPFLYVKGDPYDVGLQYGVLLKEEIARFFLEAEGFEREMIDGLMKSLAWYKKFVFKLFAPVGMAFKVRSFKKRIPEDYLAQLRGIAEGSKVPLKKFLKIIFYEDLSCSSFIIKVKNRIIHGRNADQSISFLGKYPLITHYNKTGAYKYIDIGVVGIPYITSGVNEKGLTLSWNGANARAISGNGTMMMFNRILEECQNLEEVDRISKDVDRFVTVIGSQSEGTGAIYDIVGDDIARTDMEDHIIYAANRCVSEKMRAKFNSIEDWDWLNTARLDKYQEILSQAYDFTIDDAIALLSNTDFYTYCETVPPLGKGETINNHMTLESVVFDPQNQTVYFAFNTHFAGWSRWIQYNYQSDEVSIYKTADKRLQSPTVEKFLQVQKKWRTVIWDKVENFDSYILELEQFQLLNAWVLDGLYGLHYRIQDFEKAEYFADRLIEKYPDFRWGYSNKAFILKVQNRMEEAIQNYQKALSVSLINEYSKAYFYEQLALLYAQSGDENKSEACSIEALRLYDKYGVREKMDKRIKKLKALSNSKNK